ncbi:MAG: 23S rRNA (uracil(1939)-C(5))-methyltransferase RlmD [Coriobacteriaceae bacterium]|jgi:23S rRNA (uracil1939-C5)-methyltransferase|nr:23S rRNA (uracil(1939)-C(5))-methyltransferase RlmD [Coriobacteriaceae bacterium]
MEEQINIEKLSYGKAAVGRLSDGRTAFVENAVPGDVARVSLVADKGSYVTARIVELCEASALRVAPCCADLSRCGGCPWGMVAYPAQLEAKRNNVVDALSRIAHMNREDAEALVEPCKASKRELGYRNKVELGACFHTGATQGAGAKAGQGNGTGTAPRRGAGFVPGRTDSIETGFDLGFSCNEDAYGIGQEEARKAERGGREAARKAERDSSRQDGPALVCPARCPIAHKAIEGVPAALRGALRFASAGDDLGIFRVGVRHSLRTGDLEIALWTVPGPFPRAMVAKTLRSAVRASSIVRVLAAPGKARSVKGVEVLDGKGYWEERLDGLTFKTSAPSFFQVNTAQAEALIQSLLSLIPLDRGTVVADLYAGGGTFSLPLAKAAGTVFAVESASSSVRDLRRNAEAAGLPLEVIGGDSARELPRLGSLDALVVDPPRAGLAASLVSDIAAARPRQIAYISCDPATWARDVARFDRSGYRLAHVQPFDLFPQTYHVEVLSLFSRKA